MTQSSRSLGDDVVVAVVVVVVADDIAVCVVAAKEISDRRTPIGTSSATSGSNDDDGSFIPEAFFRKKSLILDCFKFDSSRRKAEAGRGREQGEEAVALKGCFCTDGPLMATTSSIVVFVFMVEVARRKIRPWRYIMK